MDSASPLVRALLFGSLEGLPEEAIFLFARTGLIHLFSASGFHMGVALGLARLMSRLLLPLRDSRKRAAGSLLFGMALMVFFGSVTAWSSPMVRAFAFATLRASAEALEIKAATARIFLLSLLAAALLGRGSWLSFLLSALGMAALLYAEPKRWWTLALAPWLATLPVTAWVFGLASLSAPLWNLTFSTLVAWSVLPLAILGLLLEQLGLGSTCFRMASALMEEFTRWLEVSETLIGGAMWIRPFPWAMAALLLGVFLLTKRKLLLPLLLVPLLWPAPRLALLDVGQGDSIFLRDKSSLLVDAGPPPRKGKIARSATELERLGISSIDDVLLTHPDLDHRGGLGSLLSRHRVRGALWLRRGALEKGLDAVAAAERAGVPIRFLEEGAPPGLECWLGGEAGSSNDLSPLCRAEIGGGKSILLTGDMSGKREEEFLQLPRFPRAEYLKLSHHGSRFSSTARFLRASGARTALVSAGRKNRYGHPAPAALERVSEAGMEILRTDLEGTIELE